LQIPSKLKGASYPLKGKYGLLSLSDDDQDEKLLVGPSFFAQARYTDQKMNKNDDDDVNNDDNSQNEESYKKQSQIDAEDYNKDTQIEQGQINFGYPYSGFDYNKQQQVPPSYENPYNYLPYPYLPPYNFNLPFPIASQYLQRRTLNPGLRYPTIVSPPIITPYGKFIYVQ
jgi:hypothetical protein